VSGPEGFLLVDKPGGCTSHDVVAATRRHTMVKKIGHAGTLDPMATGLLVLGLRRATRLLRFVQDAPKRYVATALFGVATESLDADGAVVSRQPMPVGESEVAGAMARFVGRQMQIPPMVSARRVEGRRLYELAREGLDIEREARPVTIHAIELLDFAPSDYPEVTFLVECGTGTYVRTLADDIARSLGGRAHLTTLRRTANGALHVDAAVALDDLLAEDDWTSLLLSPDAGLPDMRAVYVAEDLREAVANGVALPARALAEHLENGPVKIIGEDGRMLAVYDVEGNRAGAAVVLA
jgi:tRNA pseudouridine55 synthase